MVGKREHQPALLEKVGRLESWKVGRLEGWKVRRLESWKVGRLEGCPSDDDDDYVEACWCPWQG